MCSDKNLGKIFGNFYFDGRETCLIPVIFLVSLKCIFISMTENIKINGVVRSRENIRFC